MSTIGPLYCGTGASFNDGGTTAWTNPTNIQGDTTATAATCNVGANGGTSHKLRASNFGFTGLGGATVNGVTVEIERNAANNNRHYENNIQLLKGGTETGDNKSDGSTIPTGKAFKTYGGSADGWGAGLVGGDITSTGFGVSFKISRSSVNTTTTSVYRVRITVDYTSAGFTVNAVIRATQTPTGKAIDAVLKKNSGTETFALDAWKRGDIYLDAAIRRTQSPAGWTADAVVRKTFSPAGLTLESAVLRNSGTQALSAEAIIRKIWDTGTTLTVDAVIRREQLGDFSSNSIILKSRPSSFLIGDPADPGGAWVTTGQGSVSGNLTFDAAIFKTLSETLVVDSAKKKTQTGSFSVSAWVPISLNAWIRPSQTDESFALNAFIPFTLRAFKAPMAFTVDAWVHGGRFTLNAWIGPFTRVLYLYANRDLSEITPDDRAIYLHENRSLTNLYLVNRDLYLYENRTLPTNKSGYTFTIQARKSTTIGSSFTIDAHLPTTFPEPFYLDALTVGQTKEWSFTIGADKAGINEKRGTASVDAWVRGTPTGQFGLHAYITPWRIRQGSFTLSAWLPFTLNAYIWSGSTFSISAWIISVGYIKSFSLYSLIQTYLSSDLYRGILESSPAAYFPMRDQAGSSTIAEVIAGNTGTLTNPGGVQLGVMSGYRRGATWTSGYVTSAFYQPSTSDVTIECWIKTTGTGEIWQGRYGSSGTGGQGMTLTLSNNGFGSADGHVNFFLNSDYIWLGRSSNLVVNDGLLHHIVCIWDGSGTSQITTAQMDNIWVDGVKVSTYETTNGAGINAPVAGNSTQGAFLGRIYGQYTGFISDLAFYTRSLTPSEIYSHYLLGLSPNGRALTVDAYKSSITGGGPGKQGEFTFSAAIKAGQKSNFAAEASLQIGRTFSLDAYLGWKFTVDAFIPGWFSIDAYIRGNSYLIFPEDGGPATDPLGGARPSRSFKIRILIAIRHPELVDLVQTTFWFNAVCTMQKYVNTYEAIPENKRTPKQQSALEIDLKTLAYNKQRWRAAMDTPVTWTDYSQYVLWSETSFTQMARVGSGTFEAKLRGDFPEIKGGEEIVVEVDDFRVFGGYVTQIEQTYFFDAVAKPKTILRGTDYNALFNRLTVYNQRQTLGWYAAHKSNGGGYQSARSYPRGTSDQEIILDVCGDLMQMDFPLVFDYTTFVDAVDTPAPVVPWSLPGPDNTWLVTMQSIVQVTNAVFFIDPYMALHYHDRSTVTAPYPITDGAGGISCRNLQITTDISQMKNDVFAWGTLARTVSGEIIFCRVTGDGYADVRYWTEKVNQIQKYVNTYLAIPEDERTEKQKRALATDLKTLATNKARLAEAMAVTEVNSVEAYGYWQYPEMRTDIHHQEWVDKRAMAILYRYQMPIITARATVFDPGFNAGQVVTLKSSTYGVEADLVIRSVRISFAISQGTYDGETLAVPMYELSMGLDPETGWNIYDYLPYEGFNVGPDAR